MPSLRNVSGQVYFRYVDATTIDLSSLEHIGSSFTYMNADSSTGFVANVTLPSLLSVGSNVYIYQNYYMTGLRMPRLRSIGGYLHMYHLQRLRDINLRALEKVGNYIRFDYLASNYNSNAYGYGRYGIVE